MLGRRIPFGVCYLTERYREGALCGYQMTCTRPDHELDDEGRGRRCTKECGFNIGGGEERTRRLLKAWIMFGCASVSQGSHRGDAWKTIKKCADDGFLPSEQELEDCRIGEWSPHIGAAALALPAVPAVPDEPRGAGDRTILGEALGDVPAEVHESMVDLALSGSIGVTSTEQRRRQRLSKGCSYGTPPELIDGLNHGYLRPNLPPPRGLVWRCRGKDWVLAPRGG